MDHTRYFSNFIVIDIIEVYDIILSYSKQKGDLVLGEFIAKEFKIVPSQLYRKDSILSTINLTVQLEGIQ